MFDLTSSSSESEALHWNLSISWRCLQLYLSNQYRNDVTWWFTVESIAELIDLRNSQVIPRQLISNQNKFLVRDETLNSLP